MSEASAIATEFDFILPRGLIDSQGTLHRAGTMRLATAKDELVVDKSLQGEDSATYRALLMFSRVIMQLGDLTSVKPEQLEGLFTKDLAYLKAFYNRINQQGTARIPTQCPRCSTPFDVEMSLLGESTATP